MREVTQGLQEGGGGGGGGGGGLKVSSARIPAPFSRPTRIPNFCHLFPENRFLSQSVADPRRGPRYIWSKLRPAKKLHLRPPPPPPYLKVWIRYCAAIPLRRFWRIPLPEWRSNPGSREYPFRPW